MVLKRKNFIKDFKNKNGTERTLKQANFNSSVKLKNFFNINIK